MQAEREYVAFLYRELDSARDEAEQRLEESLQENTTLSPEERWERQVSVNNLTGRLEAYRAAENGLCFGRLDRVAEDLAYIGRIGLFDEARDYEPLLLDWRAPAARPFYTATVACPEGVVRRRHFRARGRAVTGFHDDVLDLAAATDGSDADAALLAAVNAPRERTMRDIVATIQAEQDEIIRLPNTGIVVIEGGPGTGKTAVALHRVAYLLYTHRERLSRWGVLVIGPNPTFLDYIGDVLPSLGETDVVFATPGELMPEVRTVTEERPEVARVKGGLAMVEVLAAAVSDRQGLPDRPIPIMLSDVTIEVDSRVAGAARERARATGLRHNDAREIFREQLIEGLVERAVAEIGEGWLTASDTHVHEELAADARAELQGSGEVRTVVDRLWPYLSPQRLLSELYTSRARIETAATALDEQDRALLFREQGTAWTVSDVPLLDEAVELLGTDRTEEKKAARERREQIEYAKGVLEILDTDEELDEERLRAADLVDAETLAERHLARDHRSLAERAAVDREWTYGHVVVDEAQELSDMDWRVIMRRCPSKSMTIVGDLAQRRSSAGARSWADMLDRYAPSRWIHRKLTINYRTPGEIMDLAAKVLALVDPAAEPPKSVRRTGIPPAAIAVSERELAVVVANLIHDSELADRLVGVIAPDGTHLDIGHDVLTPAAAKGLEFDTVVVVDPQAILAHPSQGPADLYVALTRATQQLHLVHTQPLPTVFDDPAALVSTQSA
ncbi:UvrD-helicase domain-containing protein [Nocardia transvalensis]|uniref:UvrD-helicase domain-containing protein n=1 Tax=Nocardia transvalensis TaxID=37333 RepID=UPI0018949E8C|nr:UvrD-helicase domain-containing protein [Nocardia transvalensis]MBF6330411.1 ATP-binding domain-containing protein [Nocardia transvalensis]